MPTWGGAMSINSHDLSHLPAVVDSAALPEGGAPFSDAVRFFDTPEGAEQVTSILGDYERAFGKCFYWPMVGVLDWNTGIEPLDTREQACIDALVARKDRFLLLLAQGELAATGIPVPTVTGEREPIRGALFGLEKTFCKDNEIWNGHPSYPPPFGCKHWEDVRVMPSALPDVAGPIGASQPLRDVEEAISQTKLRGLTKREKALNLLRDVAKLIPWKVHPSYPLAPIAEKIGLRVGLKGATVAEYLEVEAKRSGYKPKPRSKKTC
jgi:hypothetical protein